MNAAPVSFEASTTSADVMVGTCGVRFKSHAASDADVNHHLLAHGVAVDTWAHRPLYEELVIWCGRFNTAFFEGKLPLPAISLARGRIMTLGTYTPWRDGLALKYRININSIWLWRPKADLLMVLLHEMVHEWEEVELGRTRGGGYHTRAFWQKVQELGIPVRRRTGHLLGIVPDGSFAQLLTEYGVSLEDARLVVKVRPTIATDEDNSASSGRRPALRPWACGCTRIWASRDVRVEASCGACGRQFEVAVIRSRAAGC